MLGELALSLPVCVHVLFYTGHGAVDRIQARPREVVFKQSGERGASFPRTLWNIDAVEGSCALEGLSQPFSRRPEYQEVHIRDGLVEQPSGHAHPC